ncbi:MAG: hypothetical protein NTY03_00680 [Candidatus Bathyarchaeota archaeon]|nr:hypothetical protein [Candidatus Bathyarchaeota archaeon]
MADIWTYLQPWLLVLIWTAVVSWVYKDNRIFRIATVAMVAGGSANGILVNLDSYWNKGLLPIVNGSKPLMIVPIIISFMFVAVFFTRYSWLARIPTLTMMGISMGVMLSSVIGAQILGQIDSTMTVISKGAGDAFGIINALLIVTGVVGSVLYFTYSKEQKGVFGMFTKYGRYFLLASLGPTWAGELSYHMDFLIQYIQNIVAALRLFIPI